MLVSPISKGIYQCGKEYLHPIRSPAYPPILPPAAESDIRITLQFLPAQYAEIYSKPLSAAQLQQQH
jgi:hypothetical protein